MCGIFVSVRFLRQDENPQDICQFAEVTSKLKDANAARGTQGYDPANEIATESGAGPDAQNTYTLLLECEDSVMPDGGSSTVYIGSPRLGSRLAVEFFASELRLRGDRPIVQPHVGNGNVLCWNGEVIHLLINLSTF